MPRMTGAYEWSGRTVVDPEGEEIGTIKSIYRKRETDEPEWALVSTGTFGRSGRLVPLSGAEPRGENVAVPVASSAVSDAPHVDAADELSREDESELRRHYGSS